MKIKELMRNKGMQIGTALMMAAPAISCAAFAANDGVSPLADAGATDGSTSVVKIITDAASGLKSDAVTVIGAAIALGVVFWGAKVLWKKYKGMAT